MYELSCAILYEQMSQQKIQPRYATLLRAGEMQYVSACKKIQKTCKKGISIGSSTISKLQRLHDHKLAEQTNSSATGTTKGGRQPPL
jgi:hypothetical protein